MTSLRRGSSRDVPAIIKLITECFPEDTPYSVERIQRLCTERKVLLALVETAGIGSFVSSKEMKEPAIKKTIEIGAFILVDAAPSELNPETTVPTIVCLGTSPQYRNRGLAEQLLRTVLKRPGPWFLHVRTLNWKAICLYYKVGFEMVKWIPEYYSSAWTSSPDHAFYMRRYIPPQSSQV